MRTIIVDDEPQSRILLQDLLLKNHPKINIVATGKNIKEALTLIKQWQPDLIFLDIEMPDGTGFDVLKKLETQSFQVIFITAFNEYAITAIKFGALDYLLKPIDKEELSDAINKAHQKQEEKITQEQITTVIETFQKLKIKQPLSRIPISSRDGIHYKWLKDLIYLEAQQNYTKLVFDNGQRSMLACLHLKRYVTMLKHCSKFMKVHRSYCINLDFVDKYVRKDGGYVIMSDGTKINVSNIHRGPLLDALGGL